VGLLPNPNNRNKLCHFNLCKRVILQRAVQVVVHPIQPLGSLVCVACAVAVNKSVVHSNKEAVVDPKDSRSHRFGI